MDNNNNNKVLSTAAQVALEIVLRRFDGDFGVLFRSLVFLFGLLSSPFVLLLGFVAHRGRPFLQHPAFLHDKRMHSDGGGGGGGGGGFGGGDRRRRRVVGGGRSRRRRRRRSRLDRHLVNIIVDQINLTQDVFQAAASLPDVFDPALNAESLYETASGSVPVTRYPERLQTPRDQLSTVILLTSVDDFLGRFHDALVGDVPAVCRQRLVFGVDDGFLDDRDASRGHDRLTPPWDRIRLH